MEFGVRSSMFETLKLVYRAKPKTLAFLVFLIISLTILYIFSIWQLDLISVLPVWNTPAFLVVMQQQGLTNYAQSYFECWLWKTTVGEAYNDLLFLNFVSFYGTVIVFVILSYWTICQIRKMGKSKC